MTVPVLLDATPLADGHSARGIGAAVRGILAGFAEIPARERPVLLVRSGQEVPGGFTVRAVSWPRWNAPRLPDPWPALRGDRIVRRLAGDGIVHAVQPALVPAGRTVVTCHDLIPAVYRDDYLAGAGRAPEAAAYRRFLARLKEALLVMVPSRETADDVMRIAGVDAARIRIIPWAAPPAAHAEGPPIPPGYVLYTGAIEPHKNAPLAIEAISRAAPGTRLVMTGPWSRRRAARLRGYAARVGAAGRVEWLGLLSPGRLAAVRAGATAVLVPSRKEGFGLPVLEALEKGIPVLASDIPALREVGGDAATYLPPDDPAAWARAISAVAAMPSHERAALAGEGRRRAARFSWRRTAQDLSAAYRDALA
ncbi:MAG: glycosyltransferase family 4 protein [Thermoleophilia bacterium]